MVFKITDVGNKSAFWNEFPSKVETKKMKKGVAISIKNAKLLGKLVRHQVKYVINFQILIQRGLVLYEAEALFHCLIV